MDFRTDGKDTGYNETSSIQPVLNGEDANQTVFQRPSENLRARTEVIRKTVDNILAEMQADRGLCIVSPSDTRVYVGTGAQSGKFRLNTQAENVGSNRDLIIAPIVGTLSTNPPPGEPIRAKYYYSDGGGGEFQAVAKNTIYAYNGGNNLWIKIFKNGHTLSSPVVTIEGAGGSGSYPADGPITICVEIDKDNNNTIGQVVAALTSAPATTYLDSTETKVIDGESRSVQERTQRIFSSDAGSMAAVDAECYRITAAELDDFFQTHSLSDGDSLIISFDTIADRRACRYDTPIGGLLQIISEDSRNVAGGHVVPICKQTANNLCFFHGKVFSPIGVNEEGDYLVDGRDGSAQKLRDDLIKSSGSPYGDYMVGAGAKTPATGVPFPLGVGTVNSQVASIVGMISDNTGATAGDARVGAKEKAVGPHTLSVGSVESQVTELLTFYDQHIDATGDKHPDTHITAVARTGTPRALTVGSAGSQLAELLAHYNNHAKTSDPLDKHNFLNVANRPIITVGPTEGLYDYTSIANAIAAVRETGAFILVHPGTYTGSYETNIQGNITAPIIIVGLGTVVWEGSYLLRVNSVGGLSATLTVENITFRTVVGQTDPLIYIGASPLAWVLGLIFKHCSFMTTSSAGSTGCYCLQLATNNVGILMDACSFTDGDPSDRIPRVKVSSGFLTLHACRFYNCGLAVQAEGADYLEITGCVFDSCGYTTSADGIGVVLDLDTGSANTNVNIHHNDFLLGMANVTSFGTAAEILAYVGSFSNNRIEITRTFPFTPSGEVAPVVYVKPADIDHSFVVVDNSLDCKEFTGIKVETGRAVVRGNRLNNFLYHSGGTYSQYGIRTTSAGCVIAENYVQMSGSTGAEVTPIWCDGPGSRIVGNYVIGGGTSGYGIHSTGTGIDSTISENRVECANAVLAGISTTGTRNQISNNSVQCTTVGIKTSAYDTVTGNTINLGTGVAKGINVFGLSSLVTGNSIIGNSVSTGAVGINVMASSCLITGNYITGLLVGIDASADIVGFVISGNRISVPYASGVTPKGIDCGHPSAESTFVTRATITGNCIMRTDSTQAGVGIDLTKNEYAAVSSNVIGPFSGSLNWFLTVIETTGATCVGLGKNTGNTTATYNLYQEPA